MNKEWKNIEGSIYIECGFVNGKLIDSHTDQELPQSLINELKENFEINELNDYFEVEIPFTSSGFSDSGKLYGPPEKCYPPEYNDERLLDENCIVTFYYLIDKEMGWQKDFINLSKEVSEELFELYYDEIMEKELDFSQYDDSDERYERMIEERYEFN